MKATFSAAWLLAICLGGLCEAEEPTANFVWNTKTAATYLDERETWWMDSKTAARDHETFCISCHTAVPYALARPALRRALAQREPSALEQRLLANITKRVRFWGEVEPFYRDAKKGPTKVGDAELVDVKARESRGTEAILNALVLANECAPTGALSDDAKLAFRNLWSLQERNGDAAGAWFWLNFHNAPWEADDSQYYGTALAALAVGTAPDNYRASPDIQDGLKLLGNYLVDRRDAQSPVNRVVLLWASARWPGLLTVEQQTAIINESLEKQQGDGGWTIASLVGPWKRRDGTPLDTNSDGYATGLITLVLQEFGIPREHLAVKRGLSWLVQNQDKMSGRWPASSLNKAREFTSLAGPFMSDAATAYAVLALTAGTK